MTRASLARALSAPRNLVAESAAADAWSDPDEAIGQSATREETAPRSARPLTIEKDLPPAPPIPLPVVPLTRPPRRRVRKMTLVLAFGAALVIATGLFHVWVRLRVLQFEVDLGIELRTAQELTEANQRLRTEAAWLRRPEAIESVARTRLGMISPDPAALQVLTVTPDVLAPPTAAPASATTDGPSASLGSSEASH